MTLTSSADYGSADSIQFQLLKSGVVIDKETVPILEEKEGAAGATGLRTIQGYLYYRRTGASHATAPSNPSGNTYNFTGTYAGLVTGSGINTATSSQNNLNG